MKVAVVSGICVERDAISAAAQSQAEIIAGFPQVDDVVLVTQHLERSSKAGACRTEVIENCWEFLRSPLIRECDVLLFHWGIRYDLFNAIPFVAADHRTIVDFHNVTPANLVRVDDRPNIFDSLRQIQVPAMLSLEMWADSEFNKRTLVDWGYEEANVRVIPLVVDTPKLQKFSAFPRVQADRVRLLTVGRLVQAKGVDVLVDAMVEVTDRLEGKVSLILAGNADMSDPMFIEDLRRSIVRQKLSKCVRIKTDLSDQGLAKEFLKADVLVSPSLHEGLCLPVIEAYRAGCRVVGTDAGNLPFVVQAPDPVVPAANVGALAEGIIGVATELLTGTSAMPAAAPELIQRHSLDYVTEEIRDALGCGRSSR